MSVALDAEGVAEATTAGEGAFAGAGDAGGAGALCGKWQQWM